jgi:outer membrane protein assembly factor BamA
LKVYTKYLFACLFFLHIYRFQAQLPFTLQIVSVQQDELPAKGTYQQKHPNAISAKSEIQTYLNSLHADGYLLAGVDSLQTDTFGIKAFISRDSRFSAAHIRLGNLQPGLASRLGIVDLRNRNRYFNQSSITRQFEKIIRYYENNGYPFVTVQLDSVEIVGNELNAALNVQKNKFFKSIPLKSLARLELKKRFSIATYPYVKTCLITRKVLLLSRVK